MIKQPIPLTPIEVRVLARCPLHYHFLQQVTRPKPDPLDALVRETLQLLHRAGGPSRMSLAECVQKVGTEPAARWMVEKYYHRLAQDWAKTIAVNETMTLRISIAGVALLLRATVDRLDKTSDGGILAVLFRTESGPHPSEAAFRQDHAVTIYHALVAAAYPLKRPVRLQELWLQLDESLTIELSEDEYRRNLSDLREPVKALARGEVMARPGLHCESCPFKHRGCPVYLHETSDEAEADDLVQPPQYGKIPRQWIFKI
jgi:RecB family exonuclease